MSNLTERAESLNHKKGLKVIATINTNVNIEWAMDIQGMVPAGEIRQDFVNTRLPLAICMAAMDYSYLTDIKNSMAANTWKAVQHDLVSWFRFADEEKMNPFPAAPMDVREWILSMDLAGFAYPTIARRVNSLNVACDWLGIQRPTNKRTGLALKAAYRNRSAPKQAAALFREDLLRISLTLAVDVQTKARPVTYKSNLTGFRDIALLFLGFFGGLREAEICKLTVEDLTNEEDGSIRLNLRKVKQGGDRIVYILPNPAGAVLTCPVLLLDRWMREASITSGFIFRSIRKGQNVSTKPLDGRAIDRIVLENMALIGKVDKYSGHSMKRGGATLLANAGVTAKDLQSFFGWKSAEMPLKYAEPREKKSIAEKFYE